MTDQLNDELRDLLTELKEADIAPYDLLRVQAALLRFTAGERTDALMDTMRRLVDEGKSALSKL